ncbi:hypothetical protein BH24GEM1_BH24GEM1_07220 [soil metagenome]
MIPARRGMALPLALLALVVIAALVAGGFAAALLEQRIGRNVLYAVQAEGAAQAGAVVVIGGWDDHGLGVLAPGASAALTPVQLPGRTVYSATVSRLNGELFLVRVESIRNDAAGEMLARRELGLFVRTADTAVPGSPPVRPLANRSWVAP